MSISRNVHTHSIERESAQTVGEKETALVCERKELRDVASVLKPAQINRKAAYMHSTCNSVAQNHKDIHV